MNQKKKSVLERSATYVEKIYLQTAEQDIDFSKT